MADQVSEKTYQHRFVGGESNSYVFTTIDNVTYEVKFVSSTDYFGSYTGIEVEVYEMVISVLEKPMPGRLRADARTGPTILAIFEELYLPHRHALFFICDSSDNRKQARFRKFGLWFYNRTKENLNISKIDRIIDDNGTIILLALIISNIHPKRSRIVDLFMMLGTEEK